MRRTAVFALAIIAGALWLPLPAQAHGQLAFSEPASQTTVSAPPDSLNLYFTEAPSSGATFTVTSPSGLATFSAWSHGQPKPLPKPVQELNLVDGKWEPVFYNMGYPALVTVTHWPEQGVYTLHYQSVASDGDKVQGDVRFDYQGPMTTAPPVVTVPNQQPSLAWLWWTIAAVVVIGLAAFFLLRRRPAQPKAPQPKRR